LGGGLSTRQGKKNPEWLLSTPSRKEKEGRTVPGKGAFWTGHARRRSVVGGERACAVNRIDLVRSGESGRVRRGGKGEPWLEDPPLDKKPSGREHLWAEKVVGSGAANVAVASGGGKGCRYREPSHLGGKKIRGAWWGVGRALRVLLLKLGRDY